MRQNGSNLNGRSGARPTARRDLGQLPSGQRKRHRKPGAMYLNHSRGFSDRSARIGNSRTPRRSSRLPYALIAVGCALVLFIAAVVGYVNRSVDVVLNGQETAVRVGSTLQNLIDDQELTDTYDAGDLLAVDDSVLKRHGGEKLSVKVDGKRIKQGKWDSRELEGGEKVTVRRSESPGMMKTVSRSIFIVADVVSPASSTSNSSPQEVSSGMAANRQHVRSCHIRVLTPRGDRSLVMNSLVFFISDGCCL